MNCYFPRDSPPTATFFNWEKILPFVNPCLGPFRISGLEPQAWYDLGTKSERLGPLFSPWGPFLKIVLGPCQFT